MQIDTRGLSREDIQKFYYGTYLFELRAGVITVGELKGYVKTLEETEEYEGCAGIMQAIEVFIRENTV